MSSEPPPSTPEPSQAQPASLEPLPPRGPTQVDLARLSAVGRELLDTFRTLAAKQQSNQARARELRHLERMRELEYDEKRATAEATASAERRKRELPHIARAQLRQLGFRLSLAVLFVGSLFGLVLLGQATLAPWLIALASTFVGGAAGTAALMLQRQRKEDRARHAKEVQALLEAIDDEDEDENDDSEG
jgi:Flp pilus assembly protein TadB